MGLGKIAEAEKQLQEALRLEPGSAEAHANLATVLLAKGQGEKALAELEKARKLDPKLSLVYYNLGFALVQVRKDYQAAVQAWERAVQLDPTYEPAHYNLGLALLSLGRREEAARALERALDLQPTDLEARRVLAYVYTSLGDTTRARELGRFLKPLGSRE